MTTNKMLLGAALSLLLFACGGPEEARDDPPATSGADLSAAADASASPGSEVVDSEVAAAGWDDSEAGWTAAEPAAAGVAAGVPAPVCITTTVEYKLSAWTSTSWRFRWDNHCPAAQHVKIVFALGKDSGCKEVLQGRSYKIVLVRPFYARYLGSESC